MIKRQIEGRGLKIRLGVRGAVTSKGYVAGDVAVDRDGMVELGVGIGSGDRVAVPGFVDLQVNGFAGVDFSQADDEGYVFASVEMARHGVTAFLPTLPTTDLDAYSRALDLIGRMRGAVSGGARVHGAHLEGPILSCEKRGAHNPHRLRPASWEVLEPLVATGVVAMVTSGDVDPTAIAQIDTFDHAEALLAEPFTKLIFDRR